MTINNINYIHFQMQIINLSRRGDRPKTRMITIVLIKSDSREGGSSSSNLTSEVAVAWIKSTIGWSTPPCWVFSIKILRWEVVSNRLRVVRVRFSSSITPSVSTNMLVASWLKTKKDRTVFGHLLRSRPRLLLLLLVIRRSRHKAGGFHKIDYWTSRLNLK